MKALVVYDSQFGNTEKIASAIAETIGGDTLLVRVDNLDSRMIDGFDLLLVGSPTQAFRETAAVSKLLEQLKGMKTAGIRAAAFDTRIDGWWTGSAAKRISKKLQKLGHSLIAPPESFIVNDKEGPLAPGEIERAREWAQRLKSEKMSA